MKLETNQLIIIIFILIIIILIIKNKNKNTKNKEGFSLFYKLSPSTRNMSYDLRGDPCIIPKYNYRFFGSSIEPHYRMKSLTIG